MANRWLNQFTKTLEKEVVHLFAQVTIGAAGAPTLVTNNQSKGFASITRTGAGAYDIVMQDSWYKFFGCYVTFESDGSGPAAPDVSVYDQAIDDNPGTFSLLCQNGGVDTDPANGEVMYIHLVVGNSSAL